ncbi:unnamed protein product [Albugo candida]|uniref:Uncharacterized protein n=1 Tax=Albugo candida TaxID=65357 RepID=A0A024GI61_9STRA|nr:unnamed protein product [Albugo candida]|eukprot:CCI46023.1 unnamed protein product [Albugo candida]
MAMRSMRVVTVIAAAICRKNRVRRANYRIYSAILSSFSALPGQYILSPTTTSSYLSERPITISHSSITEVSLLQPFNGLRGNQNWRHDSGVYTFPLCYE